MIGESALATAQELAHKFKAEEEAAAANEKSAERTENTAPNPAAVGNAESNSAPTKARTKQQPHRAGKLEEAQARPFKKTISETKNPATENEDDEDAVRPVAKKARVNNENENDEEKNLTKTLLELIKGCRERL